MASALRDSNRKALTKILISLGYKGKEYQGIKKAKIKKTYIPKLNCREPVKPCP